MSFTEGGKYFPDHVLLEAAKRNHPVIEKFFNEREEFETWERTLRGETYHIKDILIQLQGEPGWRITSAQVFNGGMVDDVFTLAVFRDRHLEGQSRAIGMGIVHMGHEITDGPTLAAMVEPTSERFQDLPIANQFIRDREGFNRFVRRSLMLGAEIKGRFPEVQSRISKMNQDFWIDALGDIDFEGI